ncbi:unnamed protein product [Choristocarpus tenellus]
MQVRISMYVCMYVCVSFRWFFFLGLIPTYHNHALRSKHTMQEGIYGLKSSISGLWLGQTFLGYLRVTATRFGVREEWQFNMGRAETTLICCSGSWGAGAYLHVKATGVPPPHHSEGGSGYRGGGGRKACPIPRSLGLCDATAANKARAARFRVVDCEGYVGQTYIGGRMVRPPAPPGATLPPDFEGGSRGGGSRGRPGQVGPAAQEQLW